MSTNPPDKDHAADLAESEKEAASTEPGSYRQDADDEKIVEVKPIDGDSIPIQGLDPAPGR